MSVIISSTIVEGGSLISLLKGPNIQLTEFEEFQKFVDFPLKIIHIVRNPYDNIATKSLYGESTKLRKKVAENEKIQLEDTELIMKFTESHLKCYKDVPKFINYFGEGMLTLRHEDLIKNPKLFLTRICNFLEISCSTHYLDTASQAVFESPTKSRHSVQWTEEMKKKVEKAIQQYDFLQGYSFDS